MGMNRVEEDDVIASKAPSQIQHVQVSAGP